MIFCTARDRMLLSEKATTQPNANVAVAKNRSQVSDRLSGACSNSCAMPVVTAQRLSFSRRIKP